MSNSTSELEKLRAELAATKAELAQVRAVVSTSEAMITGLKLEIALLKREQYGHRSERTSRLIDQLELQLEELVTDAAEDAARVEKTTKIAAFERKKPVRKPFPEHLPRERVVIEAPTIARRWLALHDEVQQHEAELERMVADKAPDLMQAYGISTLTVAEMLILVGDNPERIRSEAALAKLCGVCPIPASSGKTVRMRLNRGGNRQANAALYRVAIVRMRDHTETKLYAARRMAEGKTRREIFTALCRPKLPALPA